MSGSGSHGPEAPDDEFGNGRSGCCSSAGHALTGCSCSVDHEPTTEIPREPRPNNFQCARFGFQCAPVKRKLVCSVTD